MRISEVAPVGWDDGIVFPMLSTAFARASRTLGQRPFYLSDGLSRALVLLRSLPGPLSWWTSRAKVYVDSGRPGFLADVIDTLRARGVSYARIGDAAWGLPVASLACAGLTHLTTHLLTFDATLSEAETLGRMSAKTRWQLRRSAREGVRVDAITTQRDLDAFCELVNETRDRMRARDLAAALPVAFYRAVFQEMVPRGDALFVQAQAGGRALAGGLFFVSLERMTYYHGASTRDRAVTALNGPTAMFWHALTLARKRGIRQFDLGAVTPTDDPAHPHHSVYHFKRGFGGRLEELHSAEVLLSPLRCRFQERVVLPAWKRMYPLYLSLVGRAA
jgi:hypothetical protein